MRERRTELRRAQNSPKRHSSCGRPDHPGGTAIDWGTIPTWVSGLGSTGALWVGAVTLRRAQDKERRSEADAVVCRDERGDCCGYCRTTTHWIASTTNGGGRPVYHVFLIAYDSETGTMGDSHLLANVLAPASPTTSISLPLPRSGPGRQGSSSATRRDVVAVRPPGAEPVPAEPAPPSRPGTAHAASAP
jgi:hypothetical protein